MILRIRRNSSINESRGRKAYRWLTESYSSVELALKKYTQAYLASVAFAADMVGKTLDVLLKRAHFTKIPYYHFIQ